MRIKVVSCSPEKIRDKICCKGKGTIKRIEILKPPEKPPSKQEEPPPKQEEPPPKQDEAPQKQKDPKPTDKPKVPEPPEVKIKDKNTIVINFKQCYCGRNCDGCCGRPVSCSCGCGGHRGNCGRPVCSCGCGGFGGNCVRLVHCSCGCGGYRGNCGSRCHEYYCIEDNSHGCSIMVWYVSGVSGYDSFLELSDDGNKEATVVSVDSVLPNDLLERILAFLSIASIFRAGSVCKKMA
ncbi:hypothetical protein LWI29_006722 [Acer saccharum]|uniref:F-box domain-containing protein n=1 Tax=Acer saccharum TaxID=4024 RepID=A0AA39TDL3_ACESA|nr:hypothetical protein LWI29_006722 [Acer saccharum]